MGTFDNINIPGPLSFVSLSQNGAGTVTPIALVAGKSVKLFGFMCSSSTVTNTIQFNSSTTGALSGVMSLALGIPLILPITNVPWFTSVSGESLQLIVAGAGQLSGEFILIQS